MTPRPHRVRLISAALAVPLLALSSCGSDGADGEAGGSASNTASESVSTAQADYPDVRAVEISSDGQGTYSLDVTISSEYDTPERYADGWRVLDPEGTVLGEKTLAHDHASEQPFTRSQSGLEIPEGVEEVTVEGRDLENGYGGATVTVDVPS